MTLGPASTSLKPSRMRIVRPEQAALEERYQELFEQTEQTLRIENDSARRRCKPFEIDPRYPTLCRQLEAVTLQLARSRASMAVVRPDPLITFSMHKMPDNAAQQVAHLTLASVIAQVQKSGCTSKSNSEIVAAVREHFANQCGAATFAWNAALVLKGWKESRKFSDRP